MQPPPEMAREHMARVGERCWRTSAVKLASSPKQILWDEDTAKAKAVIIRAVNRIHQEDPRCKDAIQLYSVAKADTESKAQKKPVYFVSCGHDGTIAVYRCQRADDRLPSRSRHIDYW